MNNVLADLLINLRQVESVTDDLVARKGWAGAQNGPRWKTLRMALEQRAQTLQREIDTILRGLQS